jgi:hypothetical protein
LDFGLLLLIIFFILLPLLERLLGRGQQQQQQQGQRRPGQPVPGPQQQRVPPHQREEEEVPFRSVPAQHRDEDEAAGMLPDDLWEILTGERRQRPQAPPPPPQPAEIDTSLERPAPAAPPPRPVHQRPEMAHRAEVRRQRAERERAQREAWERRRTREPVPPRERSLPPVTVRDRTPRERDRERLRPGEPPPGEADRYVRPVPVRQEPVVVSYDADIPGDEERRRRIHEGLERAATPAARAARAGAGPRIIELHDPTELQRAIIMAEVLGRPKGLDAGGGWGGGWW